MTRALLLTATLVLAPSAFAEDIIEVTPGLWQGEYEVTVSDNPLTQNSETYCVTPAEARRSVESLIKDITDDGSCQVSNISHSSGNLSADMVCNVAEMGAKVAGTIKGTYTKTSYTLNADAALDFGGLKLPAKASSNAKRIGECPAPKGG